MDWWPNPEFIRHRRAELRPARALGTAMVALVICALVVVVGWFGGAGRRESFLGIYAVLLSLQFGVIALGCAGTCGQAISRERELKTFDFWRTTRLTSTELLVGLLLGRPLVAYFAVGCTLPVVAVVAVLAAVPAVAVVGAYALMLLLAMFLSLFGLWASLLSERSSSGLATGLTGVVPLSLGAVFITSPFPGLGALSLFPAVLELHGLPRIALGVTPKLFGTPISYSVAAVILYGSLATWLAVMVRSNVKREFEDIRLLSPWMAVGLAVFLNGLLYAFLDSERVTMTLVSMIVVHLNAVILYIVGLTTLTPPARLKDWWRRYAEGQVGYLSHHGLAWPWLAIAAVLAYALLVAYALVVDGHGAFVQWRLGTVAIALLAFLIFAVRDVLFLQWCKLTRMRQPMLYGMGLLFLYYLAALTIVAVSSAPAAAAPPALMTLLLLTPYATFRLGVLRETVPLAMYAGMLLQVAAIAGLLFTIDRRLRRGEQQS